MTRGTHDALPDTRNENVLIYINGDLVPRDQARISVFDSGYLVGDGVWGPITQRLSGLYQQAIEQYVQAAKYHKATDPLDISR